MGTDVRSMYDKEFLYAYDLQGRDVTLTIARVTQGKLVGQGGKSSKKPVLYFKEGTSDPPKGLGLCITNARTIAAMYGGFEVEKWIGKKITLYPTQTTFGSATVDCIRIRPNIPNGNGRAAPAGKQPAAPPPSEDNDPPEDRGDVPSPEEMGP